MIEIPGNDEESEQENNLGVECVHIPQITTGKLLLIQQNTPQFGHKKQLNKNYFYYIHISYILFI